MAGSPDRLCENVDRQLTRVGVKELVRVISIDPEREGAEIHLGLSPGPFARQLLDRPVITP